MICGWCVSLLWTSIKGTVVQRTILHWLNAIRTSFGTNFCQPKMDWSLYTCVQSAEFLHDKSINRHHGVLLIRLDIDYKVTTFLSSFSHPEGCIVEIICSERLFAVICMNDKERDYKCLVPLHCLERSWQINTLGKNFIYKQFDSLFHLW